MNRLTRSTLVKLLIREINTISEIYPEENISMDEAKEIIAKAEHIKSLVEELIKTTNGLLPQLPSILLRER